MSNILSGIDRLYNPLTSYPQLNTSLLIQLPPPSSSSKHLTKANRERTDNPDPMMGILDSKTPMETTRRNAFMELGAERLNNSRKARKIKHLPLLSPTMMLSLDLHLSPNSQTVYDSWTPLKIF